MAKKTLLVLNRKSAAREDVRNAVKASSEKIDVVIPWNRKALQKAVDHALSKGVTRIVAGGGDGTLNKVANAILQSNDQNVEMGLIPLGTANDFARSWGDAGTDIARSLTAARTEPARLIDIGRINGRAFVNVASGGFGAMITATTDRDLKRRVGGLAYSVTGLARLSELTATPTRIVIDDAPARSVAMLALIVGNNRYAGGGFDVAPEADLSDGFLDLGLMTLDGLTPGSERVSKWLDPNDKTSGLIDRVKFRKAVIETETPFHLNLDGEPLVDTHFEFQVEPQTLNFVVPRRFQI